MQFKKITLALAVLLTTAVCSGYAGAATTQKPVAVQPKQFDDPLFKEKEVAVQPKQIADPTVKPQDATVQPKQFDDPLFKPKK
jgi:ABC-type sugar transport system substrate-binding protein